MKIEEKIWKKDEENFGNGIKWLKKMNRKYIKENENENDYIALRDFKMNELEQERWRDAWYKLFYTSLFQSTWLPACLLMLQYKFNFFAVSILVFSSPPPAPNPLLAYNTSITLFADIIIVFLIYEIKSFSLIIPFADIVYRIVYKLITYNSYAYSKKGRRAARAWEKILCFPGAFIRFKIPGLEVSEAARLCFQLNCDAQALLHD